MKDIVDTITMDVPLFLRMLEYAKEDAKTDIDLHIATENIIELSKINGKLNMDDYNNIIGANKPLDTSESTGTGSSGAVEGAVGSPVIRKPITTKLHNYKPQNTDKKAKEQQGDINEVTDTSVSASGSYDAPFPGLGKNKLGLGGQESINKCRAVKKPNFPKFGGPGGVFIKIKDKCKNYPYCNQGDINNIEILRETIIDIATEHNLPITIVEEIVINEINNTLIKYEK